MRSLRSMCEKECGDHWSFAAKAIGSLFAVFKRRGGVISCTVTGGPGTQEIYTPGKRTFRIRQTIRPWA